MVSFQMAAITRNCYCEFVIEFQTSTGYSLSVDDLGRPWRLSGPAKAYNVTVSQDPVSGKYEYTVVPP